MRNSLKRLEASDLVRATTSGPRPGDFPLGSLRSRAAARAIVAGYAELKRREELAELANFGDLTEVQQALIEGVEQHGVRIWMLHLHRIAEQKARVFGTPLPTAEEIRHNRAVAKEIDRLSDGQQHSLSLNNGVEWNRLKVIAEQNLLDRNK